MAKEKSSSCKLHRERHEIRDRFRYTSEIENETEIFSPQTSDLTKNINKIDWLDQYTNAHRIAEENIEFMRKWILKIPYIDLLNELKINYVGKLCSFASDYDRIRIQQFINDAIEKHSVIYLVRAYTANTSFYRQLNKDLAKRGSTFRFESKISDRFYDDQVPSNVGECIFTAFLIHHPSVDYLYRTGCVTYRGVNMTLSEIEKYIPGARILLRSFLSSSKHADIATMYLDFINREKIPVLCVYYITQRRTAMDIRDISDFPDEEEVLIRPFTVFYVKQIERVSVAYDGERKVTRIFLDEVPSTVERWKSSGTKSNEDCLIDLYDAEGRLISIGESFSRSRKNRTDSSPENKTQDEEDSRFNSFSSLTTKILEMIEELLSILSRDKDMYSSAMTDFKFIKHDLTKYCLAAYYVWTRPLLEQLCKTISTIKQLLEAKENDVEYDENYLKILLMRVNQRTTNIDFGINFKDDVPLILEQLKYETVLDERRKNRHVPELLSTLNERFPVQCASYIQKCIDLHSSIRIMGIDRNNVEHLATQLNIIPLTIVEKEHLFERCNPLIIPLQSFVSCSNIPSNAPYHINQLSFAENQRLSLTVNAKQQLLVNDSRDLYRLVAERPFLPSSNFQSTTSFANKRDSFDVSRIIGEDRWIVILGDPGSSKTTLVRWLTLLCAKTFRESKVNHQLSVRLPVLVRVGEIASALDRDPSLSLLDCLCQPTWFGTPLTQITDDKQFIREYIINGHALIILDGLDEIPNFRERQHIVKLIEEFLQEWTVCPVTFIAPFDKSILNDMVQPLCCSTIGNQVIITSRIVGYYMYPIASSRIKHYMLTSLTLPVINSFIDHWFISIYNSLDISQIKSAQMMSSVDTLINRLKSMLINNEKLQKLTSNPMMLALLCTLTLLQTNEEILLLQKQRICLLDAASNFTNTSYLQLSDKREDFLHLLIDIAVYLHQHSSSGLIEELDMRNILRNSLTDRIDAVDDFIHLIDSEKGLLVPRGLCIYGFSHLMFEEYYVCQHILRIEENNVEYNRWEHVANQFHRYALYGPRFREPLVLALSYISWLWSEDEYNSLCICLLNEKGASRFNNRIPLGAICLLLSIPDLVRLPSTGILHTMLNQCMHAMALNQWFYNFPMFIEILKTAMNALPINFVHKWLLSVNEKGIEMIGQLLLQMQSLPAWLDQYICCHICNQLVLTNYALSCCLFPFISSLDSTLLIKNDSYQCTITKNLQVENIHPLVLATIICLCGGLDRSDTDENIIQFSPGLMQRTSEFSFILSQYLNSDPQALLDYCHHELLSKSSTVSLDLRIMCYCLEGGNDESLTLPLIQRLQQLAIYVCTIYLRKKYSHDAYKPNTAQILKLLKSFIDSTQQNISQYSFESIIIIALSRLLSVRKKDFPNINLPYKLLNLDEDQLNSELFILSRSYHPDLIPSMYRRLFTSQYLSVTHRVFLSAAYIIELSIDAYERWCYLTRLTFNEDSIQETLTFDVATWIDRHIRLGEKEERHRLSQALHKCKAFVDCNTANILNEWISYSNDSNLCEFAYHAALLLFNVSASATILCCQLLGSELDDFRQRSEELFSKNVLSSWRLGQEGFLSLINICQNGIHSMAPRILKLFECIQIRLECVESLNYLYTVLGNRETAKILKLFSFIFDPSIQSRFVTGLTQYITSEESTFTLLWIFSRTKGKWNKFEVNRGISIVVEILRRNTNSLQITSAALAVFIRWKSHNYINHIVVQTRYPEITRIDAIRWSYYKSTSKTFSKILQQLTLKPTSSASIIDTAWEGMIYRKCIRLTSNNEQPTLKQLLEYCSNDRLRLFRTLVALCADSMKMCSTDVDYYSTEMLMQLYTEDKFEDMDIVFVDNICSSLMNVQNSPFSILLYTHLNLVIEYIEHREIEFFRAIQNSLLGEQDFKKLLYIIGKQSDVQRRLLALNILVYYGELTMEIAEMFLDMALENFTFQQSACEFIWRLRHIHDRQISEYLFDKLKSESLQKRYMAAILLVQLAINDQVSMNTVCSHIRNVINDPTSAKNIYLTSKFFTIKTDSRNHISQKGRLDEALATLLMQFSFIAGKPCTYEPYLFSHYSDLFLDCDHLFQRIREAPRLVSCRYKLSDRSNSDNNEIDVTGFNDDIEEWTHENDDFQEYYEKKREKKTSQTKLLKKERRKKVVERRYIECDTTSEKNLHPL